MTNQSLQEAPRGEAESHDAMDTVSVVSISSRLDQPAASHSSRLRPRPATQLACRLYTLLVALEPHSVTSRRKAARGRLWSTTTPRAVHQCATCASITPEATNRPTPPGTQPNATQSCSRVPLAAVTGPSTVAQRTLPACSPRNCPAPAGLGAHLERIRIAVRMLPSEVFPSTLCTTPATTYVGWVHTQSQPSVAPTSCTTLTFERSGSGGC